MRKTIFIVLACMLCTPLLAQISYDEIKSSDLNAVRKFKIKLPNLISEITNEAKENYLN